MAIKKLKKVEKCSYCGKESRELIKVGPVLRYCNYQNCYAKACYASGGILAEMIQTYCTTKIKEEKYD